MIISTQNCVPIAESFTRLIFPKTLFSTENSCTRNKVLPINSTIECLGGVKIIITTLSTFLQFQKKKIQQKSYQFHHDGTCTGTIFFVFRLRAFAMHLVASFQSCFLFLSKGQLISKCLLGVIVLTKEIIKFLKISTLASKKRTNQRH